MISPRKGSATSAGDLILILKAQLEEKQKIIDSMQAAQEESQKTLGQLDENKKTIDELTEDLKNTTDALRVCGVDIVSVREHNAQLKRLASETEEKLWKMQLELSEGFQFVEEIVEFKGPRSDDNGVNDPLALLQRYDQASLVLIASEMGKKLRQIEEERVDAKRLVTDSKVNKTQQEALRKAYKELQEAHLTQAKFIQKLQKENAEVVYYYIYPPSFLLTY